MAMTLELKRYGSPAYLLGGVVEITPDTEYGDGRFAIEIFDRRVFASECFEYVKDPDTKRVFVRNGEWVRGRVTNNGDQT